MTSCSSCGGKPARKVVINAFHDNARIGEDRARRRAGLGPHCFNGLDIPTDYAALVVMVERFKAEQPINELEIAAHGTGSPERWGQARPQDEDESDADYAREVERVQREESDAPGHQGRLFYRRGGPARQVVPFQTPGGARIEGERWTFEAPGSAIIGSQPELVSGRTIQLNPAHATLSRRLGRCIEDGGQITWQCCNLAIGLPPHRDFLAAFTALVPPSVRVVAAVGQTGVGTTGLQGDGTPGQTYDGFRQGRAGITSQTIYRNETGLPANRPR